MPPQNPDQAAIQNMFDRLAPRYDLFNHLTSLGLATGWRQRTLESLKPGMRVLDLGCGTGDLSLAAAKRLAGSGEVIGLDFSEKMLEFAAGRARRAGLNGHSGLSFILKKAEELPVEATPYDLVVSGFVLRNLYENIDRILAGVYRSLKAGGQISFLDITEPPNAFLKALWKLYMHTVTAVYGKLLFGKDYPVLYLTQSAERFLRPTDFIKKLEAAGFREVRAQKMMLGIIAIYRAVK